jgi:putative FmdB family regulatory protein
MPTYDYQCSTCGTAFEVVQSFSEDALTKCPTKKSGNSPLACTSPGRGKVHKVFSAPGITFKGSGFYKTDSRTGSGSSSTESSSTSGAASTSDSSKGDSSSTPASGSTSDTSSKSTPATSAAASD